MAALLSKDPATSVIFSEGRDMRFVILMAAHNGAQRLRDEGHHAPIFIPERKAQLRAINGRTC